MFYFFGVVTVTFTSTYFGCEGLNNGSIIYLKLLNCFFSVVIGCYTLVGTETGIGPFFSFFLNKAELSSSSLYESNKPPFFLVYFSTGLEIGFGFILISYFFYFFLNVKSICYS